MTDVFFLAFLTTVPKTFLVKCIKLIFRAFFFTKIWKLFRNFFFGLILEIKTVKCARISVLREYKNFYFFLQDFCFMVKM